MIKKKYDRLIKRTNDMHMNDQPFTNHQIDDILSDQIIGSVYNGCSMSDIFIPNHLKPYSIMNTDTSNRDGEHWVAIYQSDNLLYVYDSFARSSILTRFKKRMKGLGFKIILCNKIQDQPDNSIDCGIRCIIWLLFVFRYGINKCRRI